MNQQLVENTMHGSGNWVALLGSSTVDLFKMHMYLNDPFLFLLDQVGTRPSWNLYLQLHKSTKFKGIVN